jgi:hypothetical protein
MTPEQFVYWLQGFMEMADPTTLTEKQTQQIKDHLALVFDKQTPDRNTLPSLNLSFNPIDNPSLNYDNDLGTAKICSVQETTVVNPLKPSKKVGKKSVRQNIIRC